LMVDPRKPLDPGAPASEFPLDHFFQDQHVELLLGNQPLQPGVLLLRLLNIRRTASRSTAP
jgi:hypothetical protein